MRSAVMTHFVSVFIFIVAGIQFASAGSVPVDTTSNRRYNEKSVPADIKGLKNNGAGEYLIRKVVLDAGHGGHDPGCVGKISKEKDIALAITLQLGKLIENAFPDVQVIYTRNTDVFIPLHERAAIANKNHADLFISIHMNAAPGGPTAYGTETFVLGIDKAKSNLDVAKRENASIKYEVDYEKNYDGYDPDSPEGHILLSLFQNAFLSQSIYIAEKIEKQFVSQKRKSRGVKQGGLLVLKHATMPAILVEAGFLSNVEEEKYLNTAKGQDVISRSIFAAFKDYKSSIEVRQKAPAEPLLVSMKEEVTSDTHGGLLEFGVQFMSSSDKSDPQAKKLASLGTVKIRSEAGNYKYQIGDLRNYDDAVRVKDALKTKGFKDAFIVAYENLQKISVQEAMGRASK
jgi:N-acetylmuramoyl-L-alanine amidase